MARNLDKFGKNRTKPLLGNKFKLTDFLFVYWYVYTVLLFLFFSVRQKVKDLIDFIQDDERLREERRKAKKNKDKFVGLSGDNNDSRYS